MVTEDAVLKALDKPRKAYSILQATDPGGSSDALQVLLMRMRDEGKVKFDINKGNRSGAAPDPHRAGGAVRAAPRRTWGRDPGRAAASCSGQALRLALMRLARATCFADPTGMGSMPAAEKSGLCDTAAIGAGTSARGSTMPTTVPVRAKIVKTVLTRRMMVFSGAVAICTIDPTRVPRI